MELLRNHLAAIERLYLKGEAIGGKTEYDALAVYNLAKALGAALNLLEKDYPIRRLRHIEDLISKTAPPQNENPYSCSPDEA